MAVIKLTAAQALNLQSLNLTNAKHALRSAERCAWRSTQQDSVRSYLQQAQGCIARARRYYAHAMAIGTLTHHYKRWSDGWRAVVRCDGWPVWIGIRAYGKRQSAQRAAAKRLTHFMVARATVGEG